ncbi:aspartate/glutamate racemase family protein [Paraburkholderia gardini]|uniref:L-aspartate/glutamate-specific racemase n=1 Tax=Paraburkholderia gardini TaxID=2823469 RepID=A0ABM8U363_9BURK|nr:aspartate/glutamate racemase family protein [Paraburkholderia gardini]CAG4897706.1 L-aspartate/glutamate-specific racemase [Paraburkholderia gardini]CAG4919838.1 L-aspartate/glutamate-specific racemase [Paraburkholderia gardini]
MALNSSCHGIVHEAYKRVIDGLQTQGVEGVMLGCTEIALLSAQKDMTLPVFDTTALHAQAAVSQALA